MEVDDAFDLAVVDDYEGCDLFLFHLEQRVGGEGGGGDGLRGAVHDVAGGAFEGVGADTFEEAAEVAVGDDAGEGDDP